MNVVLLLLLLLLLFLLLHCVISVSPEALLHGVVSFDLQLQEESIVILSLQKLLLVI